MVIVFIFPGCLSLEKNKERKNGLDRHSVIDRGFMRYRHASLILVRINRIVFVEESRIISSVNMR